MPYSLCIDAGDPCTSYVGQTDIDGDPREWGDETDMGSDEVMRVQKQTLEQGQSALLELGGGGSDPNEEVLVKFENLSGPSNIGLTATKMRVDLHKEGTTEFEALKRTVIAETNLSKGDYLVTMTIPIDEEVLKNIKPLNTSMMYWDEVAQRWKHAVTNNSSPTEPRNALWLEKYPYHQPPTVEQLRLRGLGAHGVYWNPSEKKGFMWANVDHMTDFQAMAPKAGDFNVDGDVDPNDLSWFVGRWLHTNCQTTQDWCGGASIDNDESVDFVDFTMLAANWWLEGQ